ncbi:MAG: CopG family transcriptional regulator [Bacteroidales bacterium]|nr:CopG family transcriptional regulator [Bacteroidales bacterium]
MAKIGILVDYTDNFAASPVNEDIACVVTARTFPELKKEVESALRDHIAWMREDGDAIPSEFEGEWVFDWQLTTKALLHYTEGLVSKSAISKATGINQQQLTHYSTGYRTPRPAMRKKIVDGIHSIAEQLSAIS